MPPTTAEKQALNTGNRGPTSLRWDCLFFIKLHFCQKWPSQCQWSRFCGGPRHGHAVCTLQVHPPISPILLLLLKRNLSQKDIAGSLMTLIGTICGP